MLQTNMHAKTCHTLVILLYHFCVLKTQPKTLDFDHGVGTLLLTLIQIWCVAKSLLMFW